MDGMIAQGNKRVFDPVCAKASMAFFDSYKAGNDELTSNFRAARAFIQEYKKGAKVATNSPCLQATKVYAANIKRWETVDKAIKEWITKMEALVKMWEDQAGKLVVIFSVIFSHHVLFFSYRG